MYTKLELNLLLLAGNHVFILNWNVHNLEEEISKTSIASSDNCRKQKILFIANIRVQKNQNWRNTTRVHIDQQKRTFQRSRIKNRSKTLSTKLETQVDHSFIYLCFKFHEAALCISQVIASCAYTHCAKASIQRTAYNLWFTQPWYIKLETQVSDSMINLCYRFHGRALCISKFIASRA